MYVDIYIYLTREGQVKYQILFIVIGLDKQELIFANDYNISHRDLKCHNNFLVKKIYQGIPDIIPHY